jgi:hypothetical protein
MKKSLLFIQFLLIYNLCSSYSKDVVSRPSLPLTASDIASFFGIQSWVSKIDLPEKSYKIEIIEFEQDRSPSIQLTSKPIQFVGSEDVVLTGDTSLALMINNDESGHYKIVITDHGRLKGDPQIHSYTSTFLKAGHDQIFISGLPDHMTYGVYVFIGITGDYDQKRMYSMSCFTKGIALKVTPLISSSTGETTSQQATTPTEAGPISPSYKGYKSSDEESSRPILNQISTSDTTPPAKSDTDYITIVGVADDTRTYTVSRESFNKLMPIRKKVEEEIANANRLSDNGDVFYEKLMKLKQQAQSNPKAVDEYNSKLDEFYRIKEQVTIALKKSIKDAQDFNAMLRSLSIN